MDDEKVKVFRAWGSPLSWRVEIALKLKGIPFECIEEDLQNKSPELLKCNPIHKKIPVLLHNGRPISESQVIIEYIDETWPSGEPILPLDPYQRAMARFWGKFIDDKCLPSIWNAISGPEKEWEKLAEEAHENLSLLEKELETKGGSNKKFFGGQKMGFVDIVASFIGFWLGAIQEAIGKEVFTNERYPCLCRWALDFVSCDIIKENLPSRDRLVAILKLRFQAAKATEEEKK